MTELPEDRSRYPVTPLGETLAVPGLAPTDVDELRRGGEEQETLGSVSLLLLYPALGCTDVFGLLRQRRGGAKERTTEGRRQSQRLAAWGCRVSREERMKRVVSVPGELVDFPGFSRKKASEKESEWNFPRKHPRSFFKGKAFLARLQRIAHTLLQCSLWVYIHLRSSSVRRSYPTGAKREALLRSRLLLSPFFLHPRNCLELGGLKKKEIQV